MAEACSSDDFGSFLRSIKTPVKEEKGCVCGVLRVASLMRSFYGGGLF